MVASKSDLQAGIAPGSLEHGARAPLEAGLQSAGGGSAPPAAAAAGAQPPTDSSNPLSALLNGDIDPGPQEGPVTSGLSVGSGPGPNGPEIQIDPVQARLQQIAMEAKSPLIRQMARNELRRLVGERV